ncbi:FecR family protein [Mucilaginibacter auburnensis]|uniref:FecR protein n=1 Tax=Mucilaginibacter auburnensis TaxID=1457233 RepID=A0A2H9VR55_9SPHI|nr:FecR domain-containing protein [Mucilaginibacter auburnensis]PJJ83312.1 FecR protein [Mucilaginibacter auburnensis]
MEYSKENLAALLRKQQWTADEYKWLLQYINHEDNSELEHVAREDYEQQLIHAYNNQLPFSTEVLANIHSKLKENEAQRKQFKLSRWVAVAASVIGVLFCTVVYLHNKNIEVKPKLTDNLIKNDVAPGTTKAMLKLSNGSTVVLNDDKTEHIAHHGGADIVEDGGKLSFNKESAASVNDNTYTLSYNSLITPRGGQFQLQLADGTRVWVNSASQLQFPAVFKGKERRVKLVGEAYFEVAKNKEMPFIVEVGSSQVKVLGTHFNIRAYAEEGKTPVEATLLEGSIRFTNADNSVLLKPGEQASLAANGALALNENVDTDEITAWKNGFFHFQKRRLDFIMRELARWYDIEVVYKDPIDASFFAEMPKNTNLSDALKALQLTGKVRFAVDGKRVTVLKQ